MEHTSQPPPARIDEDSDPDFDDLDGMDYDIKKYCD